MRRGILVLGAVIATGVLVFPAKACFMRTGVRVACRVSEVPVVDLSTSLFRLVGVAFATLVLAWAATPKVRNAPGDRKEPS